MSNSLLTIDMITRKAVQLFRNSNAFLKRIDRQYDASFARTGAKIGTTLRIRLPNDYTVRTGATASVQNTNEVQTTLTVATQKGVDVSFSSEERAMSLDDFSDRILAPMVNNLAGAVAVDVMGGVEGVPNLVQELNGSSAMISPTADTWLAAGAALDQMSAPREGRTIIVDPRTQARTVSALSGLFNPQRIISEQYSKGMMGMDVLGFDWYMDQSVIKHTTGAYSTLTTVNGASQTGTSITVAALAGPLKAGDIVSFAGVHSVNRVNKQSTGELAQFVVTADVATSATSIGIYPALTPGSVAFATVDASPADSAAVTSPVAASAVYRKNFAFHPQAVTMVTADLALPTGAVIAASRVAYDNISMRIIDDYVSSTDQWLSRLDLLYGYLFVRPEWACVVCDIV